MSRVKQGIDWAGSAQTVWFFVPAPFKALAAVSIAAFLGTVEHLPWAAVFVLSLVAFCFAMVAVLMVNELIRARNESDVELQLSKPRPKVMVVFSEKFSGHFVSQPAKPNQFCIENVGEEAAVNVEVHNVVLTHKTIHFEPVQEPIKAARGGMIHRIGLDADILGEGDLESTDNVADTLVSEHIWHHNDRSEMKWPLTISYVDPNGRRFQTQGHFISDKTQRRVWFEFDKAAYLHKVA